MLFATPKFMIQAIVAAKKLAWKPQLYLASVSIEPTIMAIARANAPDLTKGARAIAFVKNPNDPVWRKDPAVALYRSILKRFAPAREGDRRVPLVRHGGRVDDGRRAPARRQEPDARRAARARRGASTRPPTRSCCPGTRLRTSARDAFPLDTVYLYRYDNRQWVRTRGPVRRPMTKEERDTMRKLTRTAVVAARGARRARAGGRRDRGVHDAEALGVLRGGQRHPHRRVGRRHRRRDRPRGDRDPERDDDHGDCRTRARRSAPSGPRSARSPSAERSCRSQGTSSSRRRARCPPRRRRRASAPSRRR